MATYIVLVTIVLFVMWAISAYNRLVGLRNQYKNGFAQIDVQLKRRHDLVPNLVETARAYMKHERETLEAVIAARNQAVSATVRAAAAPGEAAAVHQLESAENALTATLGRLFALSEAYPELKADQTMQQLHEELASTENRIAFSRQAYNDGVMEFNTVREQFPGSVIANMFAFKAAELLQVTETEEERKPVKVAF
ncbi:LemA family protein [Oxalobacteraceae bacterium R-40]|uniref:LemA family protein n=1 Tax=Keguizhuia sedimenti TaxID=3064264 RepID=A0ABU1BJL2_9BURK|nr:LemA family protein [Oxalobacteraceae bacterium R-40]